MIEAEADCTINVSPSAWAHAALQNRIKTMTATHVNPCIVSSPDWAHSTQCELLRLAVLVVLWILVTMVAKWNVPYEVLFWNCFLFDLILHIPVNNCSDKLGRGFLCWTSTKQGLMCRAQGHNIVWLVRFEPAAIRSRALSHCAPAHRNLINPLRTLVTMSTCLKLSTISFLKPLSQFN